MDILYTTNDAFIPQIATGMCSIFENNKHIKEITIHIISDGISQDNKQKLTMFCHTYNRNINIIELGDISTYFDFSFDTLGWNNVILSRLLLDQLLPKTVNKIIYLDGDTVVIDSLDELWETDMQNFVIGGSIEPTVDKKRKNSLGIPENQPYINSGVLLINLEKWRNENTGKKIIEYYKAHDGKLFAADQDAINGTLHGQIYIFSPKFNFYTIHSYYPYKMLKKLTSPAAYISEEIFKDAFDSPTIIHFLGEDRPWRAGNNHPYKDKYEYYLSLTPWKDTPKDQNWKLYFFFFNTFTLLTKPFPMVRHKIISSLIPFVMKIRKKSVTQAENK